MTGSLGMVRVGWEGGIEGLNFFIPKFPLLNSENISRRKSGGLEAIHFYKLHFNNHMDKEKLAFSPKHCSFMLHRYSLLLFSHNAYNNNSNDNDDDNNNNNNNNNDNNHAMICKRGGLVIQHHNEIHDLKAELLSAVCKDVEVEPTLQPLSGETLNNGANTSSDARLDIHARRFWERQGSLIEFFHSKFFRSYLHQ